MNELLNKEPVKRVEESLKQFNSNLKILVLDTTARTVRQWTTNIGQEGELYICVVF